MKNDDNLNILHLVTGQDEYDQDIWAYALIPIEKYLPFKQAETEGNYDLSEFGNIIYSGEGKHPPQNIIDEAKEKYGADSKFEEKLDLEYKKLITEFTKQLDNTGNKA